MMRKIFLLFLLIPFSFFACKEDEESPVPDARVSISLVLSNYPVFANAIGEHLTCPSDLLNKDRIGLYGYGGIILFHTMDLERPYAAYDRTCPFEVKSSVKINVNSDGNGVCPQCGSLFNLLSGYGEVLSGKAKYPLRRYNTRVYTTSVHGDELYVTD